MKRVDVERLASELAAVSAGLTNASPCFIQSKIRYVDNGKRVLLKANAEGFVYLAGIFLKLAKEARQHSHVHFDSNSIPESSDFDFIVMYDENPEDLEKPIIDPTDDRH
ncbi:MAG TPA: hypothetical protein VHY09_05805 [Candidatus Methylacidiphilales bacterium]|jgi:hypothetical protein|nr:hypothetical protein [Candidatus Methylacidiphilales bacterium]